MSLRHLIIGSLFLTLAAAPAAHAQLSEYSCDALWHERNTIYARNGYCFKTDRAIEAFGRGCFPPFGRLSGHDADRVRQIQYWEARDGCRD
jgi:hypothetical protein